MVDDEAYTNAMVGATLEFAGSAAAAVGEAPGTNWSAIRSQLYLPLSDSIYAGG